MGLEKISILKLRSISPSTPACLWEEITESTPILVWFVPMWQGVGFSPVGHSLVSDKVM